MTIAAVSAMTVVHFHGAWRSLRQSAATSATVAAPPMARYCTTGVRSQALAASTAIVTRIHQAATPVRPRWFTINALSLKRNDRSGDAGPEPLPPEGDAPRSDRGGSRARPAPHRAGGDLRAARASYATRRRYDHRRAPGG